AALDKLDQLIGGGPVIIQNGVNIGSTVDVHPRTSIGFNQDSTKLFLFTVDGRQSGYSVGMSLYQLAEYMLQWDVYQGLNLDGGGSTTMWVRGEIVNSPSDIGGERSVSNSLLIISETFTDTLSQIRISPDPVYVIDGGTVTFSAKGFDQYYNPVTIAPGSTFWSCDTFLGTINQSGLFTAKDDTLIGYVYADVNGIRDSALVYMTQIDNITLSPTPIILQVGQNQIVTPTARDNYNNIINLALTDYNWSCTDSIGTISTSGNFYATALGTGFIYADYDSVIGSVPVSIGVSEYVVIDDFSDVDGYSLTGVLVNLAECSLTLDTTRFISPESSGRLKYSFTGTGTSALYLETNIPVSGTPDKIGIHVYGDGRGHWLRGEFRDADNERFIIDFTSSTPGIDWTGWQYCETDLSTATPSWANPGATLNFPITWWRLYLAETNNAKKDSGSIYLDDFKVHFIATDIQTEEELIPEKFELNQNYPNPFNPSTIISYSLPEKSIVKIRVFDTLGREVLSLVNEEKPAGVHQVEFKGSNLASGVYLYRIEAGNFFETKKMILLK
ncbi:MAG: phosphodiester glycosidase family protein, partial [Ignavibacteriales bacterium]|nr:phosphodiester glycosidase family protein [Ignavibacteriales bacterium]